MNLKRWTIIPLHMLQILHRFELECLGFFCCLVILSFCMAFNILFSTLCTKLDLPYLVDISLAHSIYDHPIDPMGIYFLQSSHGEEHIAFHNIIWDTFVFITKKGPISCVTWIKKCPSIVFSLVFMLVGWYYVFHRCGSHYGWCDNCWSHFNIFNFVSCHLFVEWPQQLWFKQRISSIVINIMGYVFPLLP
jgi:hypothetical protein